MNLEESISLRIEPKPDFNGDIGPLPVPMETAQVLQILLDELRRINSPWMNLTAAAAYLDCSPSLITRLKNSGVLKAHYLEGVSHARFHREDLDNLPEVRRAKHIRPVRKTQPAVEETV